MRQNHMTTVQTNTKRIIRQKEVSEKLGLSKATIWTYVRTRDDFPKPIRLGANSVGWLESEIDAFIDARIAASRA